MDTSEKLKLLIAQGKTKQAISKLLSLTKDTNLYDEVVQQSAKLAQYEKEKRLGTQSNEGLNISLSRINNALLSIIDQLPDNLLSYVGHPISTTISHSQVEIILEGNPSNFDAEKRKILLHTIAAVLDIDSRLISIKRVIAGSIKIIVELPEGEATKLIQIYVSGEFDVYSERLAKEQIIVKSIHKATKVVPLKSTNSSGHLKKITKSSLSNKSWKLVASIAMVIGIFGGMAEFTGYNLRDLWGSKGNNSFSLTVLVHGKKGKDDILLPNRGVVYLIYGDAKIPEQINNEGEATFKQIPESFFSPEAKVEILFEDPEGEPYKVANRDSLYDLKTNTHISLVVVLEGMEQISGIIEDFETGKPIDSVIVRIFGKGTLSNRFGEFTLDIPEDQQKQFITLRAFKEGYKDWELKNIPTTNNKKITIPLKKE